MQKSREFIYITIAKRVHNDRSDMADEFSPKQEREMQFRMVSVCLEKGISIAEDTTFDLGREQVQFFSPELQHIQICVLLPASMTASITAPGQFGTKTILKTIEGAILTRTFKSDTDALERFLETIKDKFL